MPSVFCTRSSSWANPYGAELTISRLEGAKRQLDTAIRLWLDAGDPLAIHTLTMAAYGVLNDLLKHENVDLHSRLDELLTAVGRQRFRRLANMLKHADRDPEAPLSLPTDEENESRIGLAVTLYRNLASDMTREMRALDTMFKLAYPKFFQIDLTSAPVLKRELQIYSTHLPNDIELRRDLVRVQLNQGSN